MLARAFPRLFLRWASPSDAELGRIGEDVACTFLSRRGARVLARRLHTRWGEVDAVLRRGSELVLVEVKTGRVPAGASPRWRPSDRFDDRRRRRLERAARGLAAGMRPPPSRWSLELVEVRVTARGRCLFRHEEVRGSS